MAEQPIPISEIADPSVIRVQLLASGRPVHAPMGGFMLAGLEYYAIEAGDLLGIIPNAAVTYGAIGDGVANNVTPFTNAAAAGKLTFIPKPATRYEFTTPLNGFDIGGAWFPDPSMTWVQLTDSGQFNLYRGRRTGDATGANIWRLSDRIFLGEAASKYAGDVGGTDGGNSWTKNQADCPWYLPLNAGVLWTSGGHSTATNNSPYGFVSAVKTSNIGQGGIGFGAAVVADLAGANGWGFIAELQRESGAGSVYGLEVGAKNKGSNGILTPNAQVVGVYGLWAAGGGDSVFGGASVNPSTAAVAVLKNTNTWNSGIVMMKDALTAGEAMALSSEGTGGAHTLNWYNAAGNIVFSIQSTATDAVNWILRRGNGGLSIIAGTRIAGLFTDVASAVNYLQFSPAATTANPTIFSQGSDTNISGILLGKGTGGWQFKDGGAAVKFSYNTTGIGFFAAAPVARGALAAPTGTITRTTYDTTTVTLPQLAERVYAIINDLRAYGLVS